MSSSEQHPILLQDLCGVCHVGEQKYKCPGCGVKYCCVECFRKHKLQTSCSGRVDVTKFKPRSDLMNQASVDRDYNFLVRLDRAVKGSGLARSNYPSTSESKAPTRRYGDKRGVHVYSVPRGMERSKQNKSGWNKKLKVFCWTVKWCLVDGDQVIHSKISPRIAENKLVKDSVPKDLISTDFEKYNPLFLLEKVNSSVLLPLESEKTLQQVLRSQFVIEFPNIYICFPQSRHLNMAEEEEEEDSKSIKFSNYTLPKGYSIFIPEKTDSSSDSSDSTSSSSSSSSSESSSDSDDNTLTSAQDPTNDTQMSGKIPALSGYHSDSSQDDPPDELSSRPT